METDKVRQAFKAGVAYTQSAAPPAERSLRNAVAGVLDSFGDCRCEDDSKTVPASVFRKLQQAFDDAPAERTATAQEARSLSLDAMHEWESVTGKSASASEGNAFIDGFNQGYDYRTRRAASKREAQLP